MQHEIKKSIPLLDGCGNLTEAGYAKKLLPVYDRTKVKAGLIRACEKRPVAYDTLESMANEIEQVLQNKMEREIPSAEIGELVMERLKKIDEVSYVRFASVYRQFKDINSFMTELSKLLQDK